MPLISLAQYPFEKFKAIETESFNEWKTHDSGKKVENTLTIPSFFTNGNELTVQLSSYKDHWFENSEIKLFQGKTQIKCWKENIGFPSIALNSVRTGDFNGDGLKDIKIISPYMGNGIASLNIRVIYILQKAKNDFRKISFDDKMDFNNERLERDIDGDGKYEIITMTLTSYKSHSYWLFNLYNFSQNGLISVNNRLGYPIMIQFLEKENYTITNRISKDVMKEVEMKFPKNYKID